MTGPSSLAAWTRAPTASRRDLASFARRCGIRLDPAPFVDGRFERFYADYGDGWWFDRIDGGSG